MLLAEFFDGHMGAGTGRDRGAENMGRFGNAFAMVPERPMREMREGGFRGVEPAMQRKIIGDFAAMFAL